MFEEDDGDDEHFNALLEDKCQVRLASPSHVLWSVGEGGDGDQVLRGLYCLNNFMTLHMVGLSNELNNEVPNRIVSLNVAYHRDNQT